ncbi:hypothetical protein AX15_003896 [Amanita polypyramis BW_CC]|nr:hypothetical protein AX15_003896 [Amanita polypyramis BW_CC]
MAVEPFLASRAQRGFIGTITIQAIVVIVMVAITFRFVEDQVEFVGRYKTLPCYLALFVLAEIFEFLITIDALRQRNIVQLVGILAFHLGLMVAAALQVHEARIAIVRVDGCDASVDPIFCDGKGTLWSRVLPFLIVSPCVIGASWLVLCFWIRELFAEFGWAIFHVVGANPKMKTMYRYYQILICLLKFDFFSFTGVTMQLLIVVLQRNSAEFGLTIAAIPVVLVLLILCGIAVQREIKWIMSISLVLMLASLVYCKYIAVFVLILSDERSVVVYKLVRFYEPSSKEEYVSTRATLTVFTIVAFLLLLVSFFIGLRCYLDFGRGLLESKVNDVPILQNHARKHSATMGQMTHEYDGGVPLNHRISIE